MPEINPDVAPTRNGTLRNDPKSYNAEGRTHSGQSWTRIAEKTGRHLEFHMDADHFQTQFPYKLGAYSSGLGEHRLSVASPPAVPLFPWPGPWSYIANYRTMERATTRQLFGGCATIDIPESYLDARYYMQDLLSEDNISQNMVSSDLKSPVMHTLGPVGSTQSSLLSFTHALTPATCIQMALIRISSVEADILVTMNGSSSRNFACIVKSFNMLDWALFT
ncbi:hypothetical protein PSACC_01166 [Paramicrosporidium saccamoebae]|uniref:Uncharacterized protein n=1 Tax=Paramicrosporidium saccamoebae TaxID=1246581 RepID=A0A2H9TMM4_9FUNG|nr:hypothetical protein PSACC_01166 [Paramicrosporidium saccamoebae]